MLDQSQLQEMVTFFNSLLPRGCHPIGVGENKTLIIANATISFPTMFSKRTILEDVMLREYRHHYKLTETLLDHIKRGISSYGY